MLMPRKKRSFDYAEQAEKRPLNQKDLRGPEKQRLLRSQR
jgi:hypothetical protein